MSVINGKIVHSDDDEDIEEDYSLSHSVDYGTRMQLKEKRLDRINNVSNWRKYAFSVILPRKLSEHTDSDLKLMLVSLKNTTIAASVHIHKIERELKERGCNLTILGR